MNGLGPYATTAVEQLAPDLELTNPEPVLARRAVDDLARSTTLDEVARQSLLGAVSEVVTNAQAHGLAPICLRAWAQPAGVVVTVSDGGRGPMDPDAGFRPVLRGPGEGGIGLWLAGQLCDEMALGKVPGGFRVRLRSSRRPG